MNIQTDRVKSIFRYDRDGKEYYSIGLTKKDKDGNYINGYMNCKFPKGVILENKTKIKIEEAWIDFYVKDKVTYPYIFINKYSIFFEKIEGKPQETKKIEDKDIEIPDHLLPF